MEDKKLELRIASLPNADKPMHQFYGIMAEMEPDFIFKRTKEALTSAKAIGSKLGGARLNQKAKHYAVKKDADDRVKTVEPVIMPCVIVGTLWNRLQST